MRHRFTICEMAEISVERISGDVFQVEVREGETYTRHQVTAREPDVETLGAGGDLERLIEESFTFLLEREPKESILRSFDLMVIARYFPSYPEEIRKRLASGA